MLQQVLEYIHNYFRKETKCGAWTIAGGAISPALSLKEGQRFWIIGSDLNDGVYTYRADGIFDDDDENAAGLHDETFAGTICALGVPPALVALTAEIKEWVDLNRDELNSPYQSESFNGYSYSRKTGSSGKNGGTGQFSWRDQFGTQLERWRKPYV